jgi:hypothetical protein
MVTFSYQWLPMVTFSYQWLPMVTFSYQWLPLSVVGRDRLVLGWPVAKANNLKEGTKGGSLRNSVLTGVGAAIRTAKMLDSMC